MNWIKRLLKSIRIAWYYFRKERRSNRFQIRRDTFDGPLATKDMYEVIDTDLGGVIRHSECYLRKFEAQALADAMNEVLEKSNQ